MQYSLGLPLAGEAKRDGKTSQRAAVKSRQQGFMTHSSQGHGRTAHDQSRSWLLIKVQLFLSGRSSQRLAQQP